MMSLRRIQITLVILLVLAGLLLINTPLARSQQTSLEVPQGDARVAVPPTGGIAQLGTLPLYLTRSETAYSTTTITAWTQTLALSLAGDLSPAQFAFELAATTPEATTSSAVNLQLIVDYSQIPLPYGGSFADRLTLYRVHNCAMQISVNSQQSAQVRAERPSRVLSCTDWEPLTVTNDRAGERLLADLALPLFTVDNTKDMSPADLLAEAADAAGGPSYYVLSSLAAGSQGDYSYTPLANVRDYQVDLHTGALTTGYTIPVPPPRGGSAPNVNLNYR